MDIPDDVIHAAKLVQVWMARNEVTHLMALQDRNHQCTCGSPADLSPMHKAVVQSLVNMIRENNPS